MNTNTNSCTSHDTTPDTTWVKATASGGSGGDCVEMRGYAGAVQIRDTKQHGEGPVLGFSRSEFAALIGAARSGGLDVLR